VEEFGTEELGSDELTGMEELASDELRAEELGAGEGEGFDGGSEEEARLCGNGRAVFNSSSDGSFIGAAENGKARNFLTLQNK
jgi:hypothetical protein